MPSKYKLTIAGKSHFQRGVYHAALFRDSIQLEIFKDGELVKRASLAPDPSSLARSIEASKNKIHLLCKRLGIEETDLTYDRSDINFAEKLMCKILFVRRILFAALIPIQWVLVFKHTDDTKWQKIIPDSKVFQADPFIIFKNNKYYVFYEELKFENYRGYLMAAELDISNNKLINEKIILKREHHLSYPNVFEEDGKYYMIPECAESNSVDLYECTDFPYQWEKKKTLLSNIAAVDSTPLKTKEGWYLFTTEIISGAGCNDELSIYKSSDLLNDSFTKLYDKPVISDVKNSRMAGHFIKHNGELIRLSQDCGKRYGHQVHFNKVVHIEGGYKEELVKTLKPDFGALGFHTYNQDHDVIIGDMEIARFDWYSLKRFVWGNIKKVLFKR